MIWCDLLDKWRLTGKMKPSDILKINIFQRLELAEFWGVKTNIFNVTKILIKSVANRERNSRKFERRLKQLEKNITERSNNAEKNILTKRESR